ncbi:DUF4232 domain-containing protein [Streptomyces sp. NPDC001339]|uniref:DUF4232 domain-containing protein n=1 Tax=Streptomyces sp. NPDC001339 TaxID=3364563 RepID=UPI00369F4E4D
MTARRSRRSAAYAALALGLAGSLALTGCNSSSSKSKSKKSSSSSPTSKKRKIIGGGAAAGAGAGAAASRRATRCYPTTARLSFSQQSGPKGHVTIEYKNTSDRPCYLNYAPRLRFANAKDPLPMIRRGGEALTDHTVTLRARSSAYAVIPTNTPAAKGTEQKSVAIEFMNSSEDARPYGPVTFDFAQKRDHISVGKSQVTYWNSSLAGAKLAAGVGD